MCGEGREVCRGDASAGKLTSRVRSKNTCAINNVILGPRVMMNRILMTRIKGFDGIQEEQTQECYLEYEQDTYIYLANINSIKDTFIERGAADTSVLM